MKAKVEWIGGVVRAGPNFMQDGDPYIFACTVIRRGDVAEIVGAAGVANTKMYRALKAELRSHGITKIVWDRKKSGREKHIEDAL